MMRRIVFGALTAATCLRSAAVALALPPALVDRAERATALVDVDTAEGPASGSAFCIDTKGIFVTDGHVVGPSTGKIKLVIHPAEKDQREIFAHLLGIDYDADLAVIQTDSPCQVPAMVVGNSDAVIPTQEVTAFGYPFGNMLAMDKKSFPSVSVNSGKITALRKKEGELALIQVDALVNPGDSGGPVVDVDGRVIGIVESGVPGAGLNFATPAGRLKKMLQGPLVVIDPVTLDYVQRTKRQTFSIHVTTMSHRTEDYNVEFKITDPQGAIQTASGKTSAGKCELLLAPTTDNRAITWNPFEAPPPTFEFNLALKQGDRVVGTQHGTIFLTHVPMAGETIAGNKPRTAGPNNGTRTGGPKENQMDPLPPDAEETSLVGSEKANEFRQISETEDLAKGVHYTTGETAGKDVIVSFRLLFGKPTGGNGQSVMAKSGYVVGGLIVEAGQFVNAFKVIFIRQHNGKLDPSDTYTSDWAGATPTGKQKQLAGNGERVIGICGRKGLFMRAIGLVTQKTHDLPTTRPSAN